MKILSIDVGIKHLALCLLESEEGGSYTDTLPAVKTKTTAFHIVLWDVLNISEEAAPPTCLCGKPAKFTKHAHHYCLRHSKKQSFQIPTSELRPPFIQKQKIQTLLDLADKYKIHYEKPIKKAELVQIIHEYIHQTCFEPIVAVNASKVDLITLGKNIKTKLDLLLASHTDIDTVLIENQISPIANRMKTLQGMIAQYFIMTRPSCHIEFVSSANKLKDCSQEEGKTTYSERKKLGIHTTLDQIKDTGAWFSFFQQHKKKDDLADCFLQGVWYVHHKL